MIRPISIISLLITASFAMQACNPQPSITDNWSLPDIPTENKVGAHAMPEDIAPVEAPFPTVQFTKPTFPADTVALSLSTKTINTGRIQQAIDELSLKGGGTVVVPEGEWFTGRIQLKDNINFHLTERAVLSFSGEIGDYLPAVFTRIEGVEVMSLGACIYANGASNIAVTGKGKMIGPADGPVKDKILTSDVIENIVDASVPVEERIYDGVRSEGIFPVMFISPINCTNVFIEGISLENTAFWNIVPVYCDTIIVRGVTIHSVGIPRGDGVNMESSRNALIEYNTLSTGDDCFTMKAGRGWDGLRVNKPTENVVVRYCLTTRGHGGVTCGSETAGMIRNLYVHDCVFKDTRVGIRFKTRRPRGGGGENLTYERIRINGSSTAIMWDMLGSSVHVGDQASRYPPRRVNELTPEFSNIHIRDILIEKSSYFVKVVSIPESPLNKVTIENVKASTDNLFILQDLKDAAFRNIDITSGDSAFTILGSKNVRFTNVDFHVGNEVEIAFEESDSIVVESCLNLQDTVYVSESAGGARK